MVSIKFKPHSDLFELPKQATVGSAGFDLCYCGTKDVVIKNVAGLVVPLDLGFSMEMPEGFEAQLRPRSGLAFKYGITLANSPGTIDNDFTGPVKALLLKTGVAKWNEETGANEHYEELVIKPGDRVCQMIVSKLVPDIQLSIVAELSNTERADGGFGSTGR